MKKFQDFTLLGLLSKNLNKLDFGSNRNRSLRPIYLIFAISQLIKGFQAYISK